MSSCVVCNCLRKIHIKRNKNNRIVSHEKITFIFKYYYHPQAPAAHRIQRILRIEWVWWCKFNMRIILFYSFRNDYNCAEESLYIHNRGRERERKSKNLDEDIKIKFNFRHKIFATPNFSRSFRGSIKFEDQNQSSVWFRLKFTLPCHVNCELPSTRQISCGACHPSSTSSRGWV